MYFEGKSDDIYVEVAMQHNDSYNEMVYGYVNNINTPEGGMHVEGFKRAITRIINEYGKQKELIKKSDESLTGEDIREGLTTVISIKIADPQFEGQTKQKLGNSAARTAVERVVSEQLTYFIEQNPDVAKAIVVKSLNSQRARIAARNARNTIRRKDAGL